MRVVVLAGFLAVAATWLYSDRLDTVPPHLHHDELLVGLLGHAVEQTGRDTSGRFLPAYFQVDTSIHWYPPLVVYATAAALKVLPLSEAAIRWPNVLVGALSVFLMALVARRVFRRDDVACLAAGLLALTPAHFIHSRIVTDSLYPVMFVLAWLLCLLRHLEQPGTGRLVLTTAVLGVGMYSYIASVVMMPIYLAMTLVAVLWDRPSLRTAGVALAGFLLPLLWGGLFVAQHPEIVGHLFAKYHMGQAQGQLNVFQQAREILTPWTVSDRLNGWHGAFAPGFLFVTGDSNIAHSTRQAGVFLAPMAVFMLAGVYDVVTRPTRASVIALAGFLTAPAAIVVVGETYALPRMLALLPFGVLLATFGVTRLWSAPLALPIRWLGRAAGATLVVAGGGYAAVAAVTRAHLSGQALMVAAAGMAVAVIARACDHERRWRPVAIGLLLLMPLQFLGFRSDYLGDYRLRSVFRYGLNKRGAIEQAIALRDRAGDVPVYLNEEIPYIKAFWDFYLIAAHREDLRDRARIFDTHSDILGEFPKGSLVLTDATDRALQVLGARADYVEAGWAAEPDSAGSFEQPPSPKTFVIYQKQ